MYALDALAEAEHRMVKDHLASCAECRKLYSAHLAIVQMMSQSVEPVAPSREAKAKLFARVDADLAQDAARIPAAPQAASPAFTPRRTPIAEPPRRRRFAQPVFAFAVLAVLALLAIAGGIYIFNRTSPDQQAITAILSDPNVQKVALAGTKDAPNASAVIYMVPGHSQAALIVNGLPQLPQGQGYEFWFFKNGEPQPSEVFTVNATGATNVLVQADDKVENFKGWGVTIEPRAGVPKPTGTLVIAGGF